MPSRTQPDYDEYPEWLQLIVDELERLEEEGVELISGQYYEPFSGRKCVLGHLAQQAGYDPATLPERCLQKKIAAPNGTAEPEIVRMRDMIIEHFDGETPDVVLQALTLIQRFNDRSPRLDESRARSILSRIELVLWPKLQEDDPTAAMAELAAGALI